MTGRPMACSWLRQSTPTNRRPHTTSSPRPAPPSPTIATAIPRSAARSSWSRSGNSGVGGSYSFTRVEPGSGEDVMAINRPALRTRSSLLGLALGAAIAALHAVAAQAGPCLPQSQPLLKIPELVTKNGVLRGTVVLTDEQRRLIFRSPGTRPGQPGSFFDCQPQRVRAFYGVEAVPKVPPSPGGIIDPVPGPTLRARVGDVVQLIFVNQIDPNRFPYSIDQGDKRP